MRTLEQFAVGRNLTVILKIGEISAAFSNMQFARAKFRATEVEFLKAQKEQTMFNMNEELCESIAVYRTRTEHAMALSAQRSAEKFFKKLMHELADMGTSLSDMNDLKQILAVHHA